MRPFQDRKLDGSPRHRHAIGKISAQQSKVTNGRGLLPGVDHRSALARRLADLIAGYRQGLGELDERQMALVESAAMCSVQLERMQAQIIREGEGAGAAGGRSWCGAPGAYCGDSGAKAHQAVELKGTAEAK
jgi:hypothetical protein